MDAWRRRFGDEIDLRFLTIHRAKGLEADFVALLNAVQDTLGLPSGSSGYRSRSQDSTLAREALFSWAIASAARQYFTPSRLVRG